MSLLWPFSTAAPANKSPGDGTGFNDAAPTAKAPGDGAAFNNAAPTKIVPGDATAFNTGKPTNIAPADATGFNMGEPETLSITVAPTMTLFTTSGSDQSFTFSWSDLTGLAAQGLNPNGSPVIEFWVAAPAGAYALAATQAASSGNPLAIVAFAGHTTVGAAWGAAPSGTYSAKARVRCGGAVSAWSNVVTQNYSSP